MICENKTQTDIHLKQRNISEEDFQRILKEQIGKHSDRGSKKQQLSFINSLR